MQETKPQTYSDEECIKMLESLPKNFLATQLVKEWKFLGILEIVMKGFKKEEK